MCAAAGVWTRANAASASAAVRVLEFMERPALEIRAVSERPNLGP
jgi:hypothetical protein